MIKIREYRTLHYTFPGTSVNGTTVKIESIFCFKKEIDYIDSNINSYIMVRSPQCPCPHAQWLYALLGKKWVLFILQAVDHGATTYTEIRRDIWEANTKILTDRLTELVTAGVLLKNTPDSRYNLSSLGQDLSSRLIELADWWGKENEKIKDTN